MNEHSMTWHRKAITPTFTGVCGNILQRKCACGGNAGLDGMCEDCRDKRLQRRAVNGNTPTTVPPIVREVLRSPGQSLDPKTRAFMEPRFGHDFSQVRVHADAKAAESARAVNALAYTVGNEIVFNARQFAPDTENGSHLLAHELTHTLQQVGAPAHARVERIASNDASTEREANLWASRALAHYALPQSALHSAPTLARFSVEGHHVVEEAGLAGAGLSTEEMRAIRAGGKAAERVAQQRGLTPKQLEVIRNQIQSTESDLRFTSKQVEAIHRGNVQRDFSQIGKVGTTVLLCKASDFGGYEAVEHFDNFIWDAISGGWRSRGSSQQSRRRTPLDYIESQLMRLADAGMNEKSLIHLGNAFHTVEDFFAHSNFIELINNDFRFGRTLVTGSVSPEDNAVSIAHAQEGVTRSPLSQELGRRGEEATKRTEPLSHSRISKDERNSPNAGPARRLAALVVQDLGTDVLIAMRPPNPQTRRALMAETVMAKLQRYLRPPNKDDKWWETLQIRDAGAIGGRIQNEERRTPTTVHQCKFSPLRNLEASAVSNIKIPIGVTVPVKIGSNRIWLQAGAGVIGPIGPFPLDRSLPEPSRREETGPGGFFVGGQITGTFSGP